MTTTVVETHTGEHVRTYTTEDSAISVISAYVSRGFDVVACETGKSVRLASGNAVVVVTKDA